MAEEATSSDILFCVYSKTEYFQKHYPTSQHVLWAVLAFPLHVTVI